jgi:hypothetical protein
MSYEPKNLSVLAYANGFTLWHYATADAASTVDTNTYFNSASDMLRKGDFILANVNTGATPVAGIYLVRSNTNGVVDVADITSVGAANAD